MKTFRSVLITALFIAGFFVLFINSGCKNKCGSITCSNGGTCQSNVCVCPTGYYGNACQTAYITQVLGTYNCSRLDCTSYVAGPDAWVSVVSAATTNAGYTFVISNFDNTGTPLTAVIDSEGDVQTDLANGEAGISAKGTYVAPTLTLRFYTFSIASGIIGAECTMVMTKE